MFELTDSVMTPDGKGKVVGFDDEHYVMVVLDEEYEQDRNGVWHNMRGWYKPNELTCEK
jgi:hypothetical protein